MKCCRIIAVAVVCLLCILRAEPSRAAGSDDVEDIFTGVDVDSLARALCGGSPMGEPGGIWRATVDGAGVAIMPARVWRRSGGESVPAKYRDHNDQWVIVLLDNPSPRLQPGTLMGWFAPSAKPGHYNAMIYTRCDGNRLSAPRKFTLRLVDDSHLTMTAVRRGVTINPFRLLPYMVRGLLKWRDDTPRDLDGFVKTWPTPPNPESPRYL